MEVLFLPITWCMEYPMLALLPSVAFGLGYLILRQKSGRDVVHPSAREVRSFHLILRQKDVRRLLLIIAILWLLYALYETRMSLWSKTVKVPIRVDLLLIAPVLYLATVFGLIAFVLGFRRAQPSSSPPTTPDA